MAVIVEILEAAVTETVEASEWYAERSPTAAAAFEAEVRRALLRQG